MNLGGMKNCLLEFKSSLVDSTTHRQLAKCFLARINLPYSQFACHTLTGELLIDPVWEVTSRLERRGICVMALICDGASTNHRLWKIHGQEEGLTY